MSYRPICDRWILVRGRLKGGRKWYRSYPLGFPERARILLGVWPSEPLLHVCGGMARLYPYEAGFGPNDKTMDIDPNCNPDILQDVRKGPYPTGFRAILADPPYSVVDAAEYWSGSDRYPTPEIILKHSLDALPSGGRVGVLHYMTPRMMQTKAKFIASIAIMVGGGNRERVFSVFAKL